MLLFNTTHTSPIIKIEPHTAVECQIISRISAIIFSAPIVTADSNILNISIAPVTETSSRKKYLIRCCAIKPSIYSVSRCPNATCIYKFSNFVSCRHPPTSRTRIILRQPTCPRKRIGIIIVTGCEVRRTSIPLVAITIRALLKIKTLIFNKIFVSLRQKYYDNVQIQTHRTYRLIRSR